MRILIATDAWLPQVNGVGRSLQSLAANARELGAEIEFLTPEGFRTFPLPTYPSIRCGIATGAKSRSALSLQHPMRCISPPKDQSGTLRDAIVLHDKCRLRPA